VREYEALRLQHNKDGDGFRKLAEILDAAFAQDIEVILDAARVAVARPQTILARIGNALSPLSGLSPGNTEENIFLQITEVRQLLQSGHTAVSNLQQIYDDLETNLARFLDIQRPSSKSPAESVQILISALNSKQSKAKIVKTLTFRLASVLHVDQKQAGSPIKLLDMLEDRIRKERSAIEAIAAKTFIDLSLETLTLLQRIDEKVERPAPVKSAGPSGLDAMLLPIFERIPVTTRADYKVYIPEICTGFLSLHDSIMCMKPFASTLNNIFTQFDCKFSSFAPGSTSYQFMKTQIFALHSSLNSLVPSKINSLVFLVLSRFIALFSAFASALSAAAFENSDESMKNEFFALHHSITTFQKPSNH
jgi:hypothetical protein